MTREPLNLLNLDIPDTFESERMILCAVTPDMVTTIHEAIEESRDHLRPWMPFADQPFETTREFCLTAAGDYIAHRSFDMMMCRRDDDHYLGAIGIHVIDLTIPCFEIGYWIRVSEAGKGYVSEATRLLTGIAFSLFQAERVQILMDARNERSAAVPKRLGYTLDGMIRKSFVAPDDTVQDKLVWSMIRDEWAK